MKQYSAAPVSLKELIKLERVRKTEEVSPRRYKQTYLEFRETPLAQYLSDERKAERLAEDKRREEESGMIFFVQFCF